MQPQVLPCICSIYLVTTPVDHKAVVLQLGPPDGPKGLARFRFPVELLQDVQAREKLEAGLTKWVAREMPRTDWWVGMGFLQQVATEWRWNNPTSGYTELHCLVWESKPTQLAPWSFWRSMDTSRGWWGRRVVYRQTGGSHVPQWYV